MTSQSPTRPAILAVDAGSRWVKIVHDSHGSVEQIGPIDTSQFFRDNCHTREGSSPTIDTLSLGLSELPDYKLSVTGYGRHSDLLGEGRGFNEVIAHIKGICSSMEISEFTMLDIGGQDTKVATVHKGALSDIQTNDRCAASTGRFLEAMAQTLGITFSELGSEWDLNTEALSSTCSVFAETEIIQLLAGGTAISSLAARVNASVVERILPMMTASTGPIVMSGGGGLSPAIAALLSDHLHVEVIHAPAGQFTGAIGCLNLMRESIK